MVEIVIQSHHAVVSEHMRERARLAVVKVARRLARVGGAVVRFEQDGPQRRVEIVLRPVRSRSLVAEGRARFFGPALAAAISHIEAQTRQLKRTPKARTRALARV